MQNVLSDPLFLDIGKATGTYTLQGSERCLLSDLRGDGRGCPACCLQLFPSTQTSSHCFPYAGKPASKALGIWQYSAEGSFSTFWARKELTAVSCAKKLNKWMEKGIPTRGRTGTSTSNLTGKGNSGRSCASGPSDRGRQAVTRTRWGQCVFLWGPFTILFLHLQRCRCRCSLVQGPRSCPAPSLPARIPQEHEKGPVPPVNSSGAVI
ncbi:uncharacterized protein LOC128142505 isoform X2 [Harpia harpyja]|uniref:uncharacterized protein LOC128142505 isoform X2 n=1 Tax=Harpia harpyja TaxID=202280 RepID=UPI0022B1CE8B|nr:uncharacterized protein LOC128142505 isoform X2 [Harpia harpyja]